MKFSYSQYSLLLKCSRNWKLSYVDKLSGETIGASLIFGVAIDAAITALLKKEVDWRSIFTSRFTTAYLNNKAIDTFDNEDIVYANSDFDKDVLTKTDLDLMKAWVIDLNLGYLGVNPVEVYKEVVKIKKNPYKKTTNDMFKYFNRCARQSLLRKGEVLIEAFYTQFYPKITEVITTQKQIHLKDNNTGDSIVGVIDFVVKLKEYGDVPLILDLKTSAFPYSAGQLETSSQLTLYAALLRDTVPLPSKVGYVVLCKNIPKEIENTCDKCGFKKTSGHRTCNELDSNNKRCVGIWISKAILKPEVQVIVEERSLAQVEDLLVDFGNAIVVAKNELTIRNSEACDNWYGSKCQFFNYCWKNDSTGLKRKGS